MATINELISDVELRLTRGNISDDFTIDRRQIQFWLDNIRAELIDANSKNDAETATSWDSFMVEYPCVKVDIKEADCPDVCDSNTYELTLPTKVMTLVNDMGIYRVEAQSGKTIQRIRLSEKSRIMNTALSKPSQSNIYYYRVNDKLRFLGGTDNFYKNGSLNLYLIPSSTEGLSLEDEYPIDKELLRVLLDQAEAIGRRVLSLPEDKANDGSENNITNSRGTILDSLANGK